MSEGLSDLASVGLVDAMRQAASPDDSVSESPEARYRVGDLAATFGLSRTTLLYYERLGIVEPRRDEASGYRYYTDGDVFRLMSAMLLKNVGVAPRELGERLNGDPYSPDGFAEYARMARERAEYHSAQGERVEFLASLWEKQDVVELVDVEPYYIMLDQAETGYRDFPESEGMSSLIDNVPISSFGARYDDADGQITPRWGRTIPVRLAHLVSGLPEGLPVIGGCRCVQCATVREGTMSRCDRRVFLEQTLDAMRSHARAHGYEPAGSAFAPVAMPSDARFFSLTCLPVRRAAESRTPANGLRAALDALRGLGHARD